MGKTIFTPLLGFVLIWCLFDLMAVNSWAKPWKPTDPAITLVTPEGFQKVPQLQKMAALELFHPKLNTELILQKVEEKLSLKAFQDGYPEFVKSKNGVVVSSQTLPAGRGKAALFVVANLIPEKVETAHVYVVPDKGSPFTLIVNYPAEQRAKTLGWLRAMVGALSYR